MAETRMDIELLRMFRIWKANMGTKEKSEILRRALEALKAISEGPSHPAPSCNASRKIRQPT